MRLYPPAWGIGREALSDCEIGGYSVPKGTQIFLVQWLVHRDARIFDDPDSFVPSDGITIWSNACRAALFPVRRRTARLHRQSLRHDGGRAHPGHDRTEISLELASRPETQGAALNHAQAPRCSEHAAPRPGSDRHLPLNPSVSQ